MEKYKVLKLWLIVQIKFKMPKIENEEKSTYNFVANWRMNLIMHLVPPPSSLFWGRSLLIIWDVKRIFILLINARIAAKNLGH